MNAVRDVVKVRGEKLTFFQENQNDNVIKDYKDSMIIFMSVIKSLNCCCFSAVTEYVVCGMEGKYGEKNHLSL